MGFREGFEKEIWRGRVTLSVGEGECLRGERREERGQWLGF